VAGVLTLLLPMAVVPCNNPPFSTFQNYSSLYLAYISKWLDLTYGTPRVWAYGLILQFQ
jgi:hypothetical protein